MNPVSKLNFFMFLQVKFARLAY